MTTRMEKVAEDVARAALQRACRSAEPRPVEPEKVKEALSETRAPEESQQPLNDALKAAINAAAASWKQPDQETWKALIDKAWPQAVDDTVREYFESARRSFDGGDQLQGLETLTDAVRATFGYIAATRQWPHATDSDIYCISAGLGSNGQWPHTLEDLDQALINASREGEEMGLAMSASMGRPKMYSFGSYEGDTDTAEKEGLLFATTAIELANRLARGTGP